MEKLNFLVWMQVFHRDFRYKKHKNTNQTRSYLIKKKTLWEGDYSNFVDF